MPWQADVTAVVLAGGKSTRMGQDKAQLPWQGVTLLECAAHDLLESGCTVVRTSGPQDIMDIRSGLGPLGGVYSSLEALPKAAWILFWPVDVPVEPQAVHALLEGRKAGKVAVHFQHWPLPLLVANIPALRQELAVFLETNKPVVGGWLQKLLCEVVPKPIALKNLNTPEEYARAVVSA
ncbi:MAG: molybdenum cofactor guanylyltransferase [Alphaproteobacteria bacterium]|nr:molybdenum cofactor guanylyltransferase [Alphaproteobacteria bacterium]MDD9919061.1 molybdenum cofactor guanylyltransferase [Alphaproteobacteria bacterium]